METTNYIPTGRTSLVKKDALALQVQTEYAHRPNPRITTTVSRDGQVIHKIERNLERQINSVEEQDRAEIIIKRQHAEIIGIIKKGSMMAPTAPAVESREEPLPQSVYERMCAIPGVQRVYQLDNEGNFVNNNGSDEFKQAFAAIYKNLQDLMGLFDRMPGVGITRRKGVYEVERDRLYFVSVGLECYFVLVARVDHDIDYERAIKGVISDTF